MEVIIANVPNTILECSVKARSYVRRTPVKMAALVLPFPERLPADVRMNIWGQCAIYKISANPIIRVKMDSVACIQMEATVVRVTRDSLE